MNIIIPIGEDDSNIFKNDYYKNPKALINIFGTFMIFYLIDNINFIKDDNLIIIYQKDLDKYNFKSLIENRYLNKFKNIGVNLILIDLDNQTRGPVETLYYGLQKKDIDKNNFNKRTVLLDCDTFYHIDILLKIRLCNYNMLFYFIDNDDKNIFSYIKFDNKNIITEIKEKSRISNYANTGCYCFNNLKLLMENLKNWIDYNKTINFECINDFYISSLIEKMMQNGELFIAQKLENCEFTCVGTPLQLKIFCSNFENYKYRNNTSKRFCFDFDKTLFHLENNSQNEIMVDRFKPNMQNINFLKFLKTLGNYIIIQSSINNNSDKGFSAKNSKIVIDLLEKYNICYDEIHFGKPHADFYIDNNSYNTYEDLEKNTGFYKTHIQERDFNEIHENKMNIIIKKSKDRKLFGEIYYYQNIPKNIKKYFPLFIDYGDDWYSLEKIDGITLSYLYVNESLSGNLFLEYLNVFKLIHNEKKDDFIGANIYDNYVPKIKTRYSSYDYSKYDENVSIYNKLINFFEKYEEDNNGVSGIIHGDAVFTNCIINNNSNFKLIDMRGYLDNDYTIYGDIMYDYGKIYQSLIGYDEILLNKKISNNYRLELITLFFDFIKENYGEVYIDIIKMITNSLLFSLIPLHANEKCIDFYNLINLDI